MSTVLPAANDPPGPTLVMPGKSLSAGAGFSWIGEGWGLFMRAPLMWVVLTLVMLVAWIILAFIPFLGAVATQVLSPVLMAGFVLGCWSLENGGELELEHLFAGFKRNFAGLVVLGVIYLVGVIVVMLIFAMFVGFSLLPALMAGNADALAAISFGGGLLIGTLIATILSIMLGAAIWLSPALVVMHNVPPVEAMKASFGAVFRNIIGAILFAVPMMILAVLAAIPFGLGMLVWIPIWIAATYRAYRQIFTA